MKTPFFIKNSVNRWGGINDLEHEGDDEEQLDYDTVTESTSTRKESACGSNGT